MEEREFIKETPYKLKDEDIQGLKKGILSVLVIRNMPLSYSSLLKQVKRIGKLQKQDISGTFVKVSSGKTLAGIPWHTDRSYHPQPPHFVALYSLSAAEQSKGGLTLFCDLQRAYQDMPEEMIRKLSHLQLLHFNRYMLDPKAKRRSIKNFRCVSAIHPLIQSDKTGKYLFFNLDYTAEFPLKQKLCNHIYQKSYIYEHHWKAFDLVISNNMKTNHMLQKTVNSKSPRTMLRFHLN